MPIGIVPDDLFEKELENLNKRGLDRTVEKEIEESEQIIEEVKEVEIKELARLGRNNVNEVPSSLRNVIAEEALLGTKQKDLAETFGVSQTSVSAYKDEKTSSSALSKSAGLKNHLSIVRNRVTRKASRALINALDTIDEESIREAPLKDRVSIAKDMSAIIKNMTPPEEAEKNNNIQFVFFKPPMRAEDTYEVIEALNE